MSASWAVDVRNTDEVYLGLGVEVPRVDRQANLAPGEEEVGMMAFLLGDLAELAGEVECLAEVPEPVLLFQMMLIDDLPAAAELLMVESCPPV